MAQVPTERTAWAEATRIRLGAERLAKGVALLGDLARGARAEDAERRLAELDARDRVDLVRLGLWSEDADVALGAAMIAAAAKLDPEETRRFARIVAPRCLVLPSPFDFAEFRDALTPADLTRDLLLAPPRPREIPEYLGAVHRLLRLEHLPLLAEATRSDDWFLRREAIRYLALVAQSAETGRDPVALAILAWNEDVQPSEDLDPERDAVPAKPRPIELPADTHGLPRTLQGILRRLFLEPIRGEELPAFRPFALRWLLDSTPADADLPLLRELLRAEDPNARAPALCVVARLGGKESLAILHEQAGSHDGALDPIALSELARRGAEEAFETLVTRTRDGDPFAAAGLLATGPTGVDAFVVMLCDETSREAAAKLLVECRAPDVAALFPDCDAALDAIAQRLEKAGLAGTPLSTLLLDLPELRTRANCARLVGSLAPADLDRTLLGVLDVVDHDGLAAHLRAMDAGEDDLLKRRIDSARIVVGDTAHATEILALVDGDPESDPVLLSRSACDALRDTLRQRLATRTLPELAALRDFAALAAVEGLDETLVRVLLFELGDLTSGGRLSPAVTALFAEAMRGSCRDAVAHYLAGRAPDAEILERSGTIATPEVLAWLARVRDARELFRHAHAIAELALAGDAAARAELQRAHQLQLYPWVDDLPAWTLAIGEERPDPTVWEDALCGNCCSFASVASRLEDLYEVDPFVNETGLRSRTRLLHDRFTRFAKDWHFSRAAQRFVIVR